MAEHGFVQAAAIDGGLIVKKRFVAIEPPKSARIGKKKSADQALFFVLLKALAQGIQSRQAPFNAGSFALREHKKRVTRFQLINPH